MGKYVVLYSGGMGMAADPEEQQKIMEEWGAWYGMMGENVADVVEIDCKVCRQLPDFKILESPMGHRKKLREREATGLPSRGKCGFAAGKGGCGQRSCRPRG